MNVSLCTPVTHELLLQHTVTKTNWSCCFLSVKC